AVECGRPVCRPGGDADIVEPVPDRGAFADGAVRLAWRARAGLGVVGRRGRAVPLADHVVRARRGHAAPALAAPDAGGQGDAADHGPWRLWRRGYPAQSGDLDRAGVSLGGRLGLLSLL